MIVLIVALAALALLCLVGYRIESQRAAVPARADSAPLALRVQGEGPWIRLGDSLETSLAEASAEPGLVSAGFTLRDEQGRVYEVPAGSRVKIVGVDGARRAPLEAITNQGSLNPRLSFDVPPDKVLYAAPPKGMSSTFGYRASPAKLVPEDGELVLAGSAAGVVGAADGAFPGCWLMILFLFAGSGAVAVWFRQPVVAWVSFGLGLMLALLGFAALPNKVKPSPE